MTGTKIIVFLLFKKSNKKMIGIIKILNNERVYIKPNRTFERIRIKPPTKWYTIFIVNNNKSDNELNDNPKKKSKKNV